MVVQVEKQGGILESDIWFGDVYIEVDCFYFINIFYNLFDNVVKYCCEWLVINLLVYVLEQQVIIKIEDKGVGIFKEYMSWIFSKFY